MEKIFFFDLETTGVYFWKNGIHQIAGAIRIDGEIKERFEFKVRPHEKAIIEEEALKVCGITREEIMAYPSMREVYIKLTTMLSKYVSKYDKTDKFHMSGYNVQAFDNQFLRAFFVQNGDNYFGSWFWADTLDCMILASNYLKDIRNTMPNFQQGTVAKTLGIEVDESKLHDAEYDIDVCIKIYDIVS